MNRSALTADSEVSLREITAETLGPILQLSVRADQKGFVAENAVSIAQAHFDEGAWFRAIYADETPVGFVLVHDENLREKPDKPDYYYLWRFMIDQRYQGRGFGLRGMQLLIEHVRTRPNAKQLFLHHEKGDSNAGPFYEKLGFEHTGVEEHGELEMRLVL